MAKYNTIKEKRLRRHMRIRRKVQGTAERPRLCVNFTNKHIYLQMIDDDQGKTLFSASSVQNAFSESGEKANLKGAEVLGRQIGEKAVQEGLKEIVFDRNGFKYHGRVKAIADAARKAGLQF